MKKFRNQLLRLRFYWLIARLTAYVWLLKTIGAEEELARTRVWFVKLLQDARWLQATPPPANTVRLRPRPVMMRVPKKAPQHPRH